MTRFLSLSLTAIFVFAVMVISSTGADAKGLRWNPLINDGVAESLLDNDAAAVKVQVRRRGARRGVRRSTRRRSLRRRNNAAAAAGIMGAIIGGAIIANEANRRDRRYRRRARRGDAHEDWCYRRYRSYRAWDNTFQPYRGRRRACISPYY